MSRVICAIVLILAILPAFPGAASARSLAEIEASASLRVCVAGASADSYADNGRALARLLGVEAQVVRLENWDAQFEDGDGRVDKDTTYVARQRAVADARLNRLLGEQERGLRDEQARLFAWVAHELRNPLGFLVYGLSNLRTSLADSSDAVHQRIARLGKAARRMSDLIDRSVRLQRLAGTDFVPDFDACSPGFAALEARAQITDAYPARTIDDVVCGDLPAEVTLDAELVTLALVNLLDNAIKYSPADAPITLAVDADAAHPGEIVYRVCDRGSGIGEADRQRLSGAWPRQAGQGGAGFGIGLSLVAHVARHHGGRVDCLARAGGGTCFELRLPVSRPKDFAQPCAQP